MIYFLYFISMKHLFLRNRNRCRDGVVSGFKKIKWPKIIRKIGNGLIHDIVFGLFSSIMIDDHVEFNCNEQEQVISSLMQLYNVHPVHHTSFKKKRKWPL